MTVEELKKILDKCPNNGNVYSSRLQLIKNVTCVKCDGIAMVSLNDTPNETGEVFSEVIAPSPKKESN